MRSPSSLLVASPGASSIASSPSAPAPTTSRSSFTVTVVSPAPKTKPKHPSPLRHSFGPLPPCPDPTPSPSESSLYSLDDFMFESYAGVGVDSLILSSLEPVAPRPSRNDPSSLQLLAAAAEAHLPRNSSSVDLSESVFRCEEAGTRSAMDLDRVELGWDDDDFIEIVLARTGMQSRW